jgi:integrase
MGRGPSKRFTTVAVNAMTKPGNYPDGDNLYLRIRPDQSKSWAFRYKLAGKQHWLSLGPVRDVPLAEARETARKMRNQLRDGFNPLQQRRERQALVLNESGRTFDAVATLYIGEHSAAWSNPKHKGQWEATLKTYASPVIGNVPVAAIGLDDILKILRPIWKTKTETASRLRGRIEAVIDYGTVHGWRKGDNPARWSGYLDQIFASKEKINPVQHHAAVPWAELPAVMKILSTTESSSAKALRFLIFTASRSFEVRGALWKEIDLKTAIWTIPPERMKGKKEHRVALCTEALAILSTLAPVEPAPEKLIFAGGKPKVPLSDVALSKALHSVAAGYTVHGMRSTFRDWVGESTNFPRELAEAALAHRIKDKAEAAYSRGDAIEKRRVLMQAWADYCSQTLTMQNNVVEMHRV